MGNDDGSSRPAELEDRSRLVALRARLVELIAATDPDVEESRVTTSALLERLIASALHERTRLWALLAAASATVPPEDAFVALARRLDLLEDADGRTEIFSWIAAELDATDGWERSIEMVRTPVLLVPHVEPGAAEAAATAEALATGAATALRWTRDASAPRRLSTQECAVVGARPPKDDEVGRGDPDARVSIPWRTTLILVEPTEGPAPARLRALVASQRNALVVVGTGLEPLLRGLRVSREQSAAFARFTALLRSALVVAAPDEATAEEYRGFGEALAAQGLPSPVVLIAPPSALATVLASVGGVSP